MPAVSTWASGGNSGCVAATPPPRAVEPGADDDGLVDAAVQQSSRLDDREADSRFKCS